MKAIMIALGVLLAGCSAAREQITAQYDARCREIGTTPGTEAHTRCRLTLLQADTENSKAAALMMAAGMQQQSQSYYRAAQTPVYVPRRTQCWQNGQHVTCW